MPGDEPNPWKAIVYLASSFNQLRGVVIELLYNNSGAFPKEKMEELHKRLNESYEDSQVVIDEIRKASSGDKNA